MTCRPLLFSLIFGAALVAAISPASAHLPPDDEPIPVGNWAVSTERDGNCHSSRLRSVSEQEGVRVRLQRNLPRPYNYIVNLEAHLAGGNPMPERAELALMRDGEELVRGELTGSLLRRAWRYRSNLAITWHEFDEDAFERFVAQADVESPAILVVELIRADGHREIASERPIDLSGLAEAVALQREQSEELQRGRRGDYCDSVAPEYRNYR